MILEAQHLSSGYGELQILWDVSIALQQGRLTTVVGSNGAGKTTMLRTIMGLIKPWSGKVVFDGQDVTHLPPHKKAEMGLILIPEGRQLFTEMTVLENLEMGASPARARPKMKENLEKVFELFPRLKERMHQKAGTLSGGEQQMLALGRGIMADPIVLMFDEPSLGLAPLLVIELFDIIKRLKAEGMTMLLVEQNVHLALAVSDYAYVLSEGRIEIEGEASVVRQMDEVREAYLGI
ncbi:MAG: ABC transporter ATP-binding protein [Chloroflexi bacterium]|nr:ABC transporter ATP-binding protein [Chloroflexota bacterium]